MIKQLQVIGLAKNGDFMFEDMTIQELKDYIKMYEFEISELKSVLNEKMEAE